MLIKIMKIILSTKYTIIPKACKKKRIDYPSYLCEWRNVNMR